MANNSKILTTLSDFMRTLLTPYDVDLALDDLALRLCEILEMEGAGVSLAKDGRLQSATALPPAISPLEETQEATQSGPCVTAYRTTETVAVSDLRKSEHCEAWPEYCASADQIGYRAVAGIPMKIEKHSIGAISLYSQEVREWKEEDLFLARIFADAATVYLLNASTYDRERLLNQQLQQALDSRSLIEQAKGIIAEARGVDVQAAFELIRRQARSRNASLRSVAEAIVKLGLRL